MKENVPDWKRITKYFRGTFLDGARITQDEKILVDLWNYFSNERRRKHLLNYYLIICYFKELHNHLLNIKNSDSATRKISEEIRKQRLGFVKFYRKYQGHVTAGLGGSIRLNKKKSETWKPFGQMFKGKAKFDKIVICYTNNHGYPEQLEFSAPLVPELIFAIKKSMDNDFIWNSSNREINLTLQILSRKGRRSAMYDNARNGFLRNLHKYNIDAGIHSGKRLQSGYLDLLYQVCMLCNIKFEKKSENKNATKRKKEDQYCSYNSLEDTDYYKIRDRIRKILSAKS